MYLRHFSKQTAERHENTAAPAWAGQSALDWSILWAAKSDWRANPAGAARSFSTIRAKAVREDEAAPNLSLAGHVVAAVKERPSTSLRILVAEDNPVNQKLISRTLAKLGHLVTLVSNAQQAVQAACTAAFDIILMDVEMPEMDGLEATSLIRAAEGTSSRVPIVALTAHAMSGARERCLNAGMDSYLSKPISTSDLAACLNEYGRARKQCIPAAP